MGQIVLGLIVGSVLYFHPQVTMKEKDKTVITENFRVEKVIGEEKKSVRTNVPFFKNNELDYANIIAWMGDGAKKYAWLVFIPIVIFIVTAVSNGANLTDGIDGFESEIKLFASCFETDDFREGTDAFLEKRKPNFN